MKINDLTPASYNPRTITDDKLSALGRSMKEFGDLSGIVMNIRTGNLVGGHQRLKHFDPSWPIKKRKHNDSTGTTSLGEIETPFGVWQYREVDWDEKREQAANISANRHGGEFDEDQLKDMLKGFGDEFDTELIGFNDEEIDKLFDEMKSELSYSEVELKPYRKVHVLLSFPPDKLLLMQDLLQRIIEIDGVEYMQSAN